jgi:hypothetical protein
MHDTPIPAFALVQVVHKRPVRRDPETGLWHYETLSDETVHNLLTNTGRVQLHTAAYSTTPPANGFNYIGLTADATAASATDTTLASELSGNGLTRAQGTVILATGSGNQTAVARTFTYSGGPSQLVSKGALFNLSSGGVMNHEVVFASARTLNTNDTLAVTFTLTLG